MRAMKVQYFLAYAVPGCVLPYIAVYLKQKGLDETHIGYVLAAGSLAVVLSPVLVTLLADSRIDARRIMSGLFVLSGATLLAMHLAGGFALILLVWCAHNLAYQPITPLQDGINFSIQQQRHRLGQPIEPYHRVRVWGTIGWMIGGIILFALLWYDLPVDWALNASAICAAIGAAFVLRVPDPLIRKRPDPASAVPAAARVPTFAAASTMFRPPLVTFCAAAFLLTMALVAHSAFYPIYLNERLAIPKAWLAPIINIGVLIEIFFVLGFGRLSHLLGLKRLMLISLLATALRFGLLFALPRPAIAIATQVLHGLAVIASGVIPPIFINQHAGDRWRHSMQGLYTMLIYGVARIAGNLAAGPVAHRNITAVFALAAALCAVAAVLAAATSFEIPRREAETAAGVGGEVVSAE